MGVCIRCGKETKTSIREGERGRKKWYKVCLMCYLKTLFEAYGGVPVGTLDIEGGQDESEQGVKV